MDKRIFAVLFVVLAAFFGGLLFYVYTTSIPLGISIGSAAMEVIAIDSRGIEFRLSEQKGKIVVIEFMTTNCPYCVEELEDIKQIQGKKDVSFASILLDTGLTTQALDEFVNSHGVTWFLGTSKQAGYDYKVTAVPTVLIIDRTGVIRYRGYYTSVDKIEAVINQIG
jgi:cytochrome oxidase Cu insertion factor (SCO1/SenC/PrrC family)